MSRQSGSATQPFSSTEIQRRLDKTRANFEDEEGRGDSTRPFSDSADLQRRIDDEAKAHHPESKTLARASGAEQELETRAPSTPADLPVHNLISAFSEASLASAPDARLVVAYQRWASGMSSAAFRLPHGVGGWDIIGVIQRTHDVDFSICIPFYDPPWDAPPPRLIPHHLRCAVYYNPASDNCLLVNVTGQDISLAALLPEARAVRLSSGEGHVVNPGMWRISVGSQVKQHLVDILILRRQFSVTIHEAPRGSSTSTKRSALSERGAVSKRRRGGEDVTEILLAPTGQPPQLVSEAETAAAITTAVTATNPERSIIRADGTPLLDLLDGELAVIRTTPPKGARPEDRGPSDGSGAQGTASYELSRLERIAETRSASVFTGRHSALSEGIVAKVIRYEGKSAEDLVKCAMAWKREKSFLEKLRHKNVMALEAFDGRLFAMYVEHLPASLFRGLNSHFAPSDAHAILRDTSSALAYLAAQRVVHNDIKPLNIAYSPQRGAVLLDFGLASSSDDNTPTGGTSWYVPPDLISHAKRGLPGDVWALGITMLYVLGKISLPERTGGKAWPINRVSDRDGEPRRLMNAWVDSVVSDKERLCRGDMVEGLVYQMLEKVANARIQATRITAEFERPDPGRHIATNLEGGHPKA